MFKRLVNLADRSAVFLSLLCAVHCLVLPIILIAVPTITSLTVFNDERFHVWLLFAVIPISIFAVLLGYFHHRSWPIVIIAAVGMTILIIVALLGHQVFGETGEVVASVVGSLLVAYGHIKNFKYRAALNSCHQV